MNKQDLVKEVSERLDMTQSDCARFMDCLTDIITNSLQNNDYVKLPGIGRLYPYRQTSRPGRNPRTGVDCVIRERVTAKLKVSKYLIAVLNSEPGREKR